MWRRVQSRNEVVGADWILKAALVCLFVGSSAGGYLWQKRQVHKLGSEIHGLERELEQLEKGNELLRQRYSVLASPGELDRRVEQFGMDLRTPAQEQILRLTEVNGRSEVNMARPYEYSSARFSRRD